MNDKISSNKELPILNSLGMVIAIITIKLIIKIALFAYSNSSSFYKVSQVDLIVLSVTLIILVLWMALLYKYSHLSLKVATQILIAVVIFPIFIETNIGLKYPTAIIIVDFLIMSQLFGFISTNRTQSIILFAIEAFGYMYGSIRILIVVCTSNKLYIPYGISCAILLLCIITKRILCRHMKIKIFRNKISKYNNRLKLLESIINSIPNGICAITDSCIQYKSINISNFFVANSGDRALQNSILSFIGGIEKKNGFIAKLGSDREILINIKDTNGTEIYVFTDVTETMKQKYSEELTNQWRSILLAFTHEFRTPLHWLIGTLNTLSSKVEKELIDMALNAANSILFCVNNLIYFSKLPERVYEYTCRVFSIKDTITACIKSIELENLFNSNECVFSIGTSTASRVYGDSLLYIHVLTNILINSSKSIKNGKIYISTEIKDNYLYTYINDKGYELSKDEINDILEENYNISNNNNKFIKLRHGLSLKFCRPFCKKMLGDFTIVSKEVGTIYTFWIKIDLSTVKMLNLEKKATYDIGVSINVKSPTKKPPLRTYTKELMAPSMISFVKSESFQSKSKKKVLIVDDTPMNVYVLKKMLESLYVDCEGKTNGLEALETVKKDPDMYSVILMDMNMPVMDGIEATRAIKLYLSDNRLQTIPIIALSAQDEHEIVSGAFSAGVEEYLVKPLAIHILKDMLLKYNALSVVSS